MLYVIVCLYVCFVFIFVCMFDVVTSACMGMCIYMPCAVFLYDCVYDILICVGVFG